ncbi:hypothetical protein ACTXT7_009235 [Hymenolepis weldensis]
MAITKSPHISDRIGCRNRISLTAPIQQGLTQSSNIHKKVPIFEKVPVRESSRNIVWNIPIVNAGSSSKYADPTEKIKSPTLAADGIRNGRHEVLILEFGLCVSDPNALATFFQEMQV